MASPQKTSNKRMTPKANEMSRAFLRDVETLRAIPTSKRHDPLWLEEYPFDLQLLSASRLYRESRKIYLELDGVFVPRLSSMMRALSAQDLFADSIEYTPSFTEIEWFREHHAKVADPDDEIVALTRFNEIALFHEQNHRVIWRLLPPPPTDRAGIRRYLNFAESLVLMLDLALGDELGAKISDAAERMKIIYRPGSDGTWRKRSKSEYRSYLLALQFASYLVMERVDARDLLAAVDSILPGQTAMNDAAVSRSLDINVLFTEVTNPQWQDLNWKSAKKKLSRIAQAAAPLHLPEDPVDFDAEFTVTRSVLAAFGL